MTLIRKAPQDILRVLGGNHLFLAGSIEMGVAENWQARVEKDLAYWPNLTILNPRRDDWDSSWTQDINNPKFFEQVTWELAGIEFANVVAMYLVPGTVSPISLLELGLVCGKDPRKMVVCCPDAFHRKGNVDIVCQRYGVPVHKNYETWMVDIKDRLQDRY